MVTKKIIITSPFNTLACFTCLHTNKKLIEHCLVFKCFCSNLHDGPNALWETNFVGKTKLIVVIQ